MNTNAIYLDYAAATPLNEGVFQAMQPYFSDQFFNPSATYLAAQAVRKDVAQARARIAHWLGSRPSEVVFTAGTTEANNLVIHGVMRQFPEANIVVSAIEHDSILEPAAQYNCRQVAVNKDGIVSLADLQKAIDDDTVLVSIMYANNEVGVIQPLPAISHTLAAIREDRQARGVSLPLYLHTDAAQAAGYLDVHVARLGVQFMTIGGGKIYGPKQSGALFVHAGVQLAPQVLGGGQERGMRSGTENVAGSIGLAQALDMVQKMRHEELARLQLLQKRFLDLLAEAIPQAVLNGSRQHRLANNVHITIPGQDNERLLMALDEAGVMCAAGSACSASSEEPSHVLRALGLSEAEAQASLRFTMGQGTTEAHIEKTVQVLAQIVS